MSPARLLEAATLLTLASRDTPEYQENLRRAVSTAYYAMFHTLANSNADTLVGTPKGNNDDAAAWNRTYRALEHGAARNRLRHARQMALFPDGVREFGDVFIDLQRERNTADYNPDRTFTVSSTLRVINHARQAITRFHEASPETRRNLHTLRQPARIDRARYPAAAPCT